MEDRKSRQERHHVGQQVGRPREGQPWDRPQAQRERQVVRQACCRREDKDGAHRDQPEWQRLLEQVGPAPALPGPAAEDITRDRAGKPRDDSGDGWPQVCDAQAGEQRYLARAERHRRTEGKPGEPSADRTDAVPIHCPDDGRTADRFGYAAQRNCHGSLSLRVMVTDDSGSTGERGHGRVPGSEGASS